MSSKDTIPLQPVFGSVSAQRAGGLAIGILAGTLTLIATWRYTIGLQWDSAEYFAVARSLASDLEFTSIGKRPLYNFGPFYPIALMPGVWLPFSLETWARLLNVFAHATTSWLVYATLLRVTRDLRIALGVAAFCAVAYPMIWVSRFALPDALFILLSTGTLYSLSVIQYPSPVVRELQADVERPGLTTPGKALVAAGLCTGLAAATRYNGVVLGVPLAVAVAVHLWRRRLSTLAAVTSLTLAALPLGLWFTRNLIRIGKISGHAEMDRSVGEVLHAMANALSEWLEPFPLLWGIALVFATGLYFRSGREKPTGADLYVLLVMLYVCTHAGLLIHASSTRAIELPSLRYLAPAFPGFLLLLGIALHRISGFRISLLIFGALVILHAMRTGAFLVERVREGAGGLSTRNWVESPVVIKMHELQQSGARVYCNYMSAGYLLAGLPYDRPSDLWTGQKWYREIAPAVDPGTDVYMVWIPLKGYFGTIPQTEPYEIPEPIFLDEGHRGRIYEVRRPATQNDVVPHEASRGAPPTGSSAEP